MLPHCDARLEARLTSEAVRRAGGRRQGWAPQSPDEALISDIEAFAQRALIESYADASEVDAYLCEGSAAFHAENYPGALRIYHALLPPLANADFHVDQEEMVDEMLGVDLESCVLQYLISLYMTTPVAERATVILEALTDVNHLAYLRTPLAGLRSAAITALPDFEAFLSEWRALLQARSMAQTDQWYRSEDNWLHEAVAAQEGIEGLGVLARTSGKRGDFEAWIARLEEHEQWSEMLLASDEAAGAMDDPHHRSHFLDQAALAAQELGHDELFDRLHAAWSASPTLERLRRWMYCASASGRSEEALRCAIRECPGQAERQRALLYVLNNDLSAAAPLLAEAAPLGWSAAEHPGHLLFPLFAQWFGCANATAGELMTKLKHHCHELDDYADPGEAQLRSAAVEELVYARASTDIDPSDRQRVVSAMRKAAERRCRAVTANQRRRSYGHAAALVTACAEVDGEDGQRWAAAIRALYRRYPAFRRELDERLGKIG
ncbi:MAG: hypothetical protein V2I82_03145 [Halieaceae bacterium]|nr:hypothetical protein [Halieaceae bacterium]